jgi:superfamily II DNA or RNA helicase
VVTLDGFLSRMPTDVRARGAAFEQACKWLLENEQYYKSELSQVWYWRDWPGRWGADAGIDLVAETYDGKLWAIQAKAYDSRYSIKKADVDSFLSESSRDCFSFRLLITTTDRLGDRAAAAMRGQAIPAATLALSELAALQVNWPADPLRCEPITTAPPKVPLPHSVVAVNAAVSGLVSNDRGQLHMACGTGKTLVGMWTSERLRSQLTLVTVPSLSLLAQTLREWRGNGTVGRFLAVCSDESVSDDSFITHTADLGIPVTTDPEVIADFCRRSEPGVVIATYQSLPVVGAGARLGETLFSLLIADEAHRCAGKRAGLFAAALDDAVVPAAKRLFMTATPRIYSARLQKAAAQAELEVASMDNEQLFGPVLHALTFGEAIRRGLLSDYQVVVVGIDDAMLSEAVQRRRLLLPDGEDEELDAATLANLVAVARAASNMSMSRVVTFHNRVAAARHFSVRLPRIAAWLDPARVPLGAGYVSGTMSAGVRSQQVDRLRAADASAPFILSNARCLGEGVDVPNLDGVVFVDPKGSQIDIVQAVGRAIRSSPDKIVGTIVLPLFLAQDGGEGESDRFAPIWRVLRALRAHDETLAEELDELRRCLGAQPNAGGWRLPARIVLDLPKTVTVRDFDALTLRIIEGATDSWDQYYGLLQRFVAREGHASPAIAHEEDGLRLGAWVGGQRTLQRKGILPAERAEKLRALPGWAWNRREESWVKAYMVLADYVAVHGTSAISQNVEWKGFKIGGWVNIQRLSRKRGTLDPAAVEVLAQLPGWRWSAYDQQERLDALATYVGRHPDCDAIPRDHVEGEVDLGRWIHRCRARFGAGQLPEGVVSALDQAWPRWRDGLRRRPRPQPPTEAWRERLALLREHAQLLGTAAIPQDYRVGTFNLGAWVKDQRRGYALSRLTPEHIQLLETEVPGWSWSPGVETWDRWLARMQQYVAETGRNCPPGSDRPNSTLRRWVYRQRAAYASGVLSAERISDLEQQVPGWAWDGDRRASRSHRLGKGAERLKMLEEAWRQTAQPPGRQPL